MCNWHSEQTVCGDRDTTRTTGVRYCPIRRRCVVGEVGSTDRQSKAADKSNITNIARSPLSMAIRMSDNTFGIAVSVE